MALRINTNIPSLQPREYLRIGSEFQNKTLNGATSVSGIVNGSAIDARPRCPEGTNLPKARILPPAGMAAPVRG